MTVKKSNLPPIIKEPGDPENLRTEYDALSAYFNVVVNLRFTILGLYLAAVGLIVGGSPSLEKYFILLVLTFFVFWIELRNQSLAKNVSDRGMQIEREYWGYSGDRVYEPFYSHQLKTPADGQKKPEPDYPEIHGKVLKILTSHTIALDSLYTIILIYALINVVVKLLPILKDFILPLFT